MEATADVNEDPLHPDVNDQSVEAEILKTHHRFESKWVWSKGIQKKCRLFQGCKEISSELYPGIPVSLILIGG